VLEDDARVDEVERSGLELGEVLGGVDPELACGHLFVEPRRLYDHGVRDVNAHGPLEPHSERAREPPHATTEVERTSARDRTQSVGDVEDVFYLRVAGREEALGVPRTALLGRRREHSPHRVRLGEPLPVLLVTFQAHQPDSRRSCYLPEREG
jgi:hypothetical protein